MNGHRPTMPPTSRELLGIQDPADPALTHWLEGLPPTDPQEVAAAVGSGRERGFVSLPSPAGRPSLAVLDLLTGLLDLTTLAATDTPETVAALCLRARRPDPRDPGCPATAAVCVWGDLVASAVAAFDDRPGPRPRVAAVTGAFPSGRAERVVKRLEARQTLAAGAEELDLVLDRGSFLAGRHGDALVQLLDIREACDEEAERRGRPVLLKVILETGELGHLDTVNQAAWLALAAGADFVKTSTGTRSPGATPEATLVLLRAVRDWQALTGQARGVKPAGGIRTVPEALSHLALAADVLGSGALQPTRFRIGASSLLEDVLTHRRPRPSPESNPPEHY